MSITTRLQKQRYGELNIKCPTKDDLLDYGLKVTRLRKPVPELFDSVIFHMRFPPKRDKYYKHYIYTVEKFMEFYNQATKQSQWQIASQIVDIHLVGKLIYMNMHPNRFHGFNHFKYTWIYNILCAMRKYIIKQRYLSGEIRTNQSIAQWSAGFEKWPKPMANNAMGLLADLLYDLVQPRYKYILHRSGI